MKTLKELTNYERRDLNSIFNTLKADCYVKIYNKEDNSVLSLLSNYRQELSTIDQDTDKLICFIYKYYLNCVNCRDHSLITLDNILDAYNNKYVYVMTL